MATENDDAAESPEAGTVSRRAAVVTTWMGDGGRVPMRLAGGASGGASSGTGGGGATTELEL
tara:strand:- start:91 stop:276 length:186 start_codon:yes stop_codon:yes gene_type:complete